MNKIKGVKQFSTIVAVAAVVSAGSVSVVSAHSIQACVYDVYDFCGNDQSCIKSGQKACVSHKHPGRTPPDAPDPSFSADPGSQPSGNVGVNRLRQH